MYNDTGEIIKEHVRRCERDYAEHTTYAQSLVRMREIKLAEIAEEEVERLIKHFLYKWGRMGRVLGRSEFRGWESNIVKLIRYNSEGLEEFRKKDLTDSDHDLSRLELDIKELYESFKEKVGPIAATKILHLICPDFFPMWDNNIAKAVRNELNKQSEAKQKVEDFSGADYFRFVRQTKDIILKNEKVLSELSIQYKRSKLRILDECFWMATNRPLSLFI